jgi:hypothetical protein
MVAFRSLLSIGLLAGTLAAQAADKGASKLTTFKETKAPAKIAPTNFVAHPNLVAATNRIASTNGASSTNRISSTNVLQAGLTNAPATNTVAKTTNQPPKYPITPGVRPVAGIVRGPYLQCATTNSIVLRWRTEVPASSVVRYGPSPTKLDRKTNSSGVLTEHLVMLTGLKPETKYYYAAGVVEAPVLATLTNGLLVVAATNATLYLSVPQRLQIGAATNKPFLLANKRGLLTVTTLDGKVDLKTTNSTLVLSTTNNALVVTATNNTLVLSSTNNLQKLPSSDGPAGKGSVKQYVVASARPSYAGADTNSYFITPPPIGAQRPVHLWVVGDPGTRKPEQKRVRDAYYKYRNHRPPDVWLMLGDNAYSSGTDLEYQGAIFEVYPTLLRQCVLWPTLGNHDAGSANSATQSGIYFDIFTLPTQGQAGGVMSGTEAYYSFDHANVHIICLDSADSDRSTNGPMWRWLKADLAANRQDWCIAYCHHPPYTKGSHDSDKEKDSDGVMRDMRSNIVPALEDGGIDLVLTGHSHCYERSFLLDSHYMRSNLLVDETNIKSERDGCEDGWGIYHKPTRGPAPHEGAVYVVAGSAGQTSGGGLLHPAMFASLNVLGTVLLDFNGPRVDASFLDGNGLVRDRFTIVKGESSLANTQEEHDERAAVRDEGPFPPRLEPLLQPATANTDLSAITNARPWDADLLWRLYQESSDLTQKSRLTWALGYIGDADTVTNLLRVLTHAHRKEELTLEEENLQFETIEALGLMAIRYEAPFEFLKKGINPPWWQTNKYWISPRNHEGPGLAASHCIQALGLSGRPEASETLAAFRKKGSEFKLKDHPDYVRNFQKDIDEAMARIAQVQRAGPLAYKRQFITAAVDPPQVE